MLRHQVNSCGGNIETIIALTYTLVMCSVLVYYAPSHSNSRCAIYVGRNTTINGSREM